MRKKAITLSLTIIIIILTIFSSFASAKNVYYNKDVTEKFFSNIKSFGNETNIITSGPISPLFNITEITLFNGSSLEIEKIERILNNRILHFFLPLTYIECKDLDFSVSYHKNIPFFIPFVRHISYFTSLFEGLDFPFNNETIWGRNHTIYVEGFTGYFCFQRLRTWKISPAVFSFAGSYKEIKIIR